MGDPPPDPEVQPLEIIVGNPGSDYGPCSLNVDAVAAGSHDVAPMTLAGKARVRILDPAGVVLFQRTLRERPTEGGSHEVLQQDQGTVHLRAGDHRIDCTSADGTRTTTLRVEPARQKH